ncbi:fungal-specific transcription factor domain-containing protein [Coprinopsis sp. MPI-PUGE-AT-0042]|nr:fungal-specific transcription factor domain-containing protein [Coprinopsis sp. MPI-PUGE-AT-0042]
MSYSDDYDNASDLADIGGDGEGGGSYGDGGNANDKAVRRRSSKACDQCRKSKCKCERTGPSEPCKSCILLGTACTFLGPSRKRGPPKGYIDAIEARLHQTEALVGIMLATKDPRARSLLDDIAKDPLGREIINRVDNSAYGVKGRKRDGNTAGSKPRPGSGSDTSSTPRDASGKIDLTSTHPSNEWQDRVVMMLDGAPLLDTEMSPEVTHSSANQKKGASGATTTQKQNTMRSEPSRVSEAERTSGEEGRPSPRRQRRRLGDHEFSPDGLRQPSSAKDRGRRLSHTYSSLSPVNPIIGDYRSSSVDSSSDSEVELAGAVGQLSLNEDEQVRYHGKASGLHLLDCKERVDGRNEGGIWRFPKARVWPAVIPNGRMVPEEEASQLPDDPIQERLLTLYFRHIHSAFPVIHKHAFFEAYKNGHEGSSGTAGSLLADRHRRRVPTLLLLAMFSLAARYDESTPLPPDPSLMWTAGDDYLDKAKVILNKSYSSSRPSTCQALLLMGYREVGIGAMAQAWTYIGMAIRMAQDLGMHRSAEGWARVGLGGRLFSESELQERKRIWYGCVIMDKYISTYIGRPLMIFERDFDTPLPSDDDPEEMDGWPIRSAADTSNPIPCHRISCFNASSTLSGILSTMVQAIYAVRPVSSRYAEALVLEGLLEKWYLGLSEHLRYDINSQKETPLPHILTLHMQYCMRPIYTERQRGDQHEDPEILARGKKCYELCASAANHISSIVVAYAEKYPLNRCSAFLCYYIFTASIMHVTTLTSHPADPQAALGLKRCMDSLEMIEIVWPSAGRALELLRGAKVNLPGSTYSSQTVSRPKRSAEQPLDDSDHLHGRFFNPPSSEDSSSTRPNGLGNYIYPTAHVYVPHAPNPAQSSHPPAIGPLSGPSSANYRWQSEDFHQHSTFNNNAPLSTSVLPQLYSTGFGDDRTHLSNGRQQSQTEHNVPAQPQRYPQYWNDYSTFSQLGQTYGGINDSGNAPAMNSQDPMYLPEQYGIYNPQTFQDR